jgi:hypothetical protein
VEAKKQEGNSKIQAGQYESAIGKFEECLHVLNNIILS